MNRTVEAAIIILTVFVHFGIAVKRPEPHHRPNDEHHHPHNPQEKCNLPLLLLPKDSDTSSSDESDFPDNEEANEPTISPPNRYPDPFLDYEAEPPYFPLGPPLPVDFMSIKHHFSNASNLAFPPFSNGEQRKKGKKRSGIGSRNFERQQRSKKRSENTKRPSRRRQGHSLGSRTGGRSRRPS